MIRAQIQTASVGDKTTSARRPRAGDNFNIAYADRSALSDIGNPDIMTCEIRAELATVQQIEANADYWLDWAETIPPDAEVPATAIIGVPMAGEEPTQARHDAMAAWMLAHGYLQATIDATLGATPSGRTANAISEEVYVIQRTLPPGVPVPPFVFGVTAQRGPYYQGGLQGVRIRLDDMEPTVEPVSIAMARYSEPDASGTFLGTSGALVWDPVDLAWYSPGLLETDDNAPCYLAILYGSAIYLTFTLHGGVFEVSYPANGVPEVPGGTQWVDSGATVTGSAGATTTVSDVSPFAVTDPLTKTRINGIEQEINAVGATWINLVPYQNPPHANGSVIEIWQ